MNFLKISKKEAIELIKAWSAISLAFAIVMTGFSFSIIFLYAIVISAFTVGIGFIFHEMAHKLTAQYYGCFAEFRSFDKMLGLAVILSFLGFIFAAPGAVFIHGFVGIVRNGKISAAGIIASLSVAFIFLLLFFLTPLTTIALYGFTINSWLALFNLIPLWNFDGVKVLNWNKKFYTLLIVIAVLFMLIQSII